MDPPHNVVPPILVDSSSAWERLHLNPSRYPLRDSKAPDHLAFSYFCYYTDFCSFLPSIHSFLTFNYIRRLVLILWKQGMLIDLGALNKTDAWDLVPLPARKHAIRYRWVYV